MSFSTDLTELIKRRFTYLNQIENDKSQKNDYLKLELEDNYYENLFLEEMEFKYNPKKEMIPKILKKYCKSVEYHSSIDEEKKSKEYKVLIDLFLNDPTVINLLENKENIDDNNVKKVVISNKQKKIDNLSHTDNIHNNLEKLKKIFNEDERKIYNKLINQYEKKNDNVDTVNIINEDISNQQNNFQKNLRIKRNSLVRKEKNINEDKITQSIKNAFINEKSGNKLDNKYSEEAINNTIISVKEISPIRIEDNSSIKENSSTDEIKSFYYLNNPTNNENNQLFNIANIVINKKKTSEFEPLTPGDASKFEKSESSKNSNIKEFNNSNIKEINETNDFSLINENYTPSEESNEKISKSGSILKDNNICLNETKESCNINTPNSSLSPKKLNDSLYKNNLFKNFRLDFNDLFESIKASHIISNKQLNFCKDIKICIENYINDFNQYLNEKIIIKFIKKFSNLWDEMFNNYINISDTYDKELKRVDEELNTYTQENPKFKELMDASVNIRNEKENELNQCEDRFSSQIEEIAVDFKNNYNNIDKGILLLNEKFALMITKKIFDMINNHNNI